MTDPLERRAARVLLVDPAGRVLLQNCCDPSDPSGARWWNTLGGGLDDGETSAQAAVREVHEETGLEIDLEAVGPVVHQRLTHFSFGGSAYRQSEDYFLVRTDPFDAAPTGHSELEMQAVLGIRWWTREELCSTAEQVYPEELLDVLDRTAPA